MRYLLVVLALALPSCGHSEPLGVRLQREAGPRYEVIYNPTTRIYNVEPK